ncbi:MAG TPA: hypothetical protein VE973_00210, partial [Candidatus Limnocylindria bacterium]|nr:hypothetical protein [Candidatus Limnocylindria bacterium]
MLNKYQRPVFAQTVKLLLLVFIAAQVLVFVPPVFAAAADSSTNAYIVQLNNPQNFGQLVTVGSNIKHLFLGSQSPLFKNVYSFESNKTILQLKSFLAGNYIYLEQQKALQAANVSVNDPGFTANPQNIDKQWGLAKAGFAQAWDKSMGSKTNIVALIDTGVDFTHEDLKNINVVEGFDFFSQQPIFPIV